MQIVHSLSAVAVEGCQGAAWACGQLNAALEEGSIVAAEWKGQKVQTWSLQGS